MSKEARCHGAREPECSECRDRLFEDWIKSMETSGDPKLEKLAKDYRAWAARRAALLEPKP